MSYDPTKFLEARMSIEAATSGKLQQNRLRVPIYEVTRTFLNNAPGLVPNYANLKQSQEQPVKLPVFNRIPAGAGTVRKCDGTGTGTTELINTVFQGITEEFHISELEHKANQVGKDAALRYLIAEKTKAIYGRIEAILKAFLEANISTTNVGSYWGALSVGNAKQVPYDERDSFFSGLMAEMYANDYRGGLELVGDYNLMEMYARIANQGAGNAQNLQWTLANIDPHFTNITSGAGVRATAYVFEQGGVGAFPWINGLHREGKNYGTEIWTTFQLPAMPGMERGLTVEHKIKLKCADTGGGDDSLGRQADAVEGHVFHVDISPLLATNDTIFKYELLAAA